VAARYNAINSWHIAQPGCAERTMRRMRGPDLAEIGGYLSWFHDAHDDTADTSESWKNLQHFLRPAERWPQFVTQTARHARRGGASG